MWKLIESIIVIVAIAVAAAFLACRAKKTLSGEDGCGCGNESGCGAGAIDALAKLEGDRADDVSDEDA